MSGDGGIWNDAPGELSPTVDEVVEKLCDLTAKASRKYGHDHSWVVVMRQARDTITQLRNERDRAYDVVADTIDLVEDMMAEIEKLEG